MADRWTIRGAEFANCNCDWGCPCQFGAPTTHGHCEAVVGGHIEEGHFNETRLDGLDWALLLYWPGEIAQGNGKEQVIIDERADPAQREGLRKILHGEATAPGATHFFVYNSTMATVLDTLYAPIELSIDVDARMANIKIDGLVESTGRPIISAFSGEPVAVADQSPERVRVHVRRDGQRQLDRARGNRTRSQGQLRPVQRPAHEPGRRHPVTTSFRISTARAAVFSPARRDQVAVIAGLAVITAAAWVYTVGRPDVDVERHGRPLDG